MRLPELSADSLTGAAGGDPYAMVAVRGHPVPVFGGQGVAG